MHLTDIPVAPQFLPEEILRVLAEHGVRFVIVGGVAARLQGSDQLTTDLDLSYERSDENVERLTAALAALGAVRVSPELDSLAAPSEGLSRRIERFVCPIGNIDVFAELHRVGGYERLAATAEEVEVAGLAVLVADLDSLIWSKSGTGRPKDADHVRSLERLKQERLRDPKR